jgi:hypothetical protein
MRRKHIALDELIFLSDGVCNIIPMILERLHPEKEYGTVWEYQFMRTRILSG